MAQMHISIPDDTTPCEFINLTPVNPLISKCQIKVCYVGEQPNRNGSIITKEVATDMANSLPGSPIVGFYNEQTHDFEQHNRELIVEDGQLKLRDTTRPFGFVDLNAKCWFQTFLDDGIPHEYLVTEGYLWTGQYPECQRVIEKGNNQSMELDENLTKAFWTKSDNGKPEFFIINETVISKLCILGENYEPCFEGASIGSVQFSFDDSFNQKIYSMMKEVSEYINKGGEQMSVETDALEVENQPEAEEVQAEDLNFEEKEDKEDEEAEPAKADEDTEAPEEVEKVEEVPEEQEKEKYNLEEVTEYVELKEQFDQLTVQYNALSQQFEELKNSSEATINTLTAFKKGVERKEKEAMIQSFYMLSDEDKKDVVDNIDIYSIDEIEAKLSVICVRNKVSFNLEEDSNETGPVVFNIDDSGSEDNLTPAWVKAVLDTEKNLRK